MDLSVFYSHGWNLVIELVLKHMKLCWFSQKLVFDVRSHCLESSAALAAFKGCIHFILELVEIQVSYLWTAHTSKPLLLLWNRVFLKAFIKPAWNFVVWMCLIILLASIPMLGNFNSTPGVTLGSWAVRWRVCQLSPTLLGSDLPWGTAEQRYQLKATIS